MLLLASLLLAGTTLAPQREAIHQEAAQEAAQEATNRQGLPPLHHPPTTTLPCVAPGQASQPITGLPSCSPKKPATKAKRRTLRRHWHQTHPGGSNP